MTTERRVRCKTRRVSK